MEESLNLGIITLLPIVVLFVLIFTTKRMLLSLTAATITGAIILGVHSLVTGETGGSAIDVVKNGVTAICGTWLSVIQEAFKEGTVGYLFLLLALFGILIALLDISNAVLEFANWLAKFANTRRKALIVTYLLGWLIFVDDYLNNMAVSTAMKKVCDKHRIPRTFLGYVVNSTAAPVCIIIPISTWGVFYSGLFESNGVTSAGGGTGMSAYIAGIPFLFFAWISLILLFFVIIGVLPMVGITRKDNKLALESGIVMTKERSMDDVEINASDEQEESTVKANPLNFIIPLVLLILVTILTSDVMVGCMLAILLTGIMMLIQKKLTANKLFDGAYSGVTSMVYIMGVIVMAMTMVQINAQDGLSDFVVDGLTPVLDSVAWLMPAIVFAFCAVYSYFGGGFWDMSMVFIPIVVPLAANLDINPLLSCMALVCAAAAGSTTYAAGDAVQITARAVDIKPFYQMLGTLPYAVISYLLSVVAFAIAGFVML
jgi:Na+/H+ antiporter NhaC